MKSRLVMSTFAFVPRKVATKAKPSTANLQPRSLSSVPASATLQPTTYDSNDNNSKGKAKQNGLVSGPTLDEDYAALVSLALSDYSIWSDPDLRRILEWNNEGRESGKESFIPLSYLLRHSPLLAGLQFESEAAIAKALRNHASDRLDVRMLVSAPSRSDWYGKDRTSREEVGGYEIRRKDWDSAIQRPEREYTHADWQERTIYLENIPPQSRTIHGIVNFTLSLLPVGSSPYRIETVTLPRHHQDQPDDLPKCKGFALVTMSHISDVELLLKEWPWDRSQASVQENKVEATKYGFRTLSKCLWDQLQNEYLTRRRRLLDEINSSEDPSPSRSSHLPQLDEHHNVPPLAISAPYPPGCLIFVRNVHPETNKTTLRVLFSAAFSDLDGDPKEGLDYIDFNKGMNSCHIRLATSAHTTALNTYFKTHSLTQSSGLDDNGVISSSGESIVMDVVSGKKEELYWEKVPENVRRRAVERVVQRQVDSTGKGSLHDQRHEDGERVTKTKRRRER